MGKGRYAIGYFDNVRYPGYGRWFQITRKPTRKAAKARQRAHQASSSLKITIRQAKKNYGPYRALTQEKYGDDLTNGQVLAVLPFNARVPRRDLPMWLEAHGDKRTAEYKRRGMWFRQICLKLERDFPQLYRPKLEGICTTALSTKVLDGPGHGTAQEPGHERSTPARGRDGCHGHLS